LLAAPRAVDAAAPDGSTSRSTQTFVKRALADGMADVELGRLAAEKASNEHIRKFGERMVEDHTKVGDELKGIASAKQIEIPAGLPPRERALRDRLSRLSGRAFDRAYIQAMVNDHATAVRLFKHQAYAGKDGETIAFASKTLPTLQDHLMMAKS